MAVTDPIADYLTRIRNAQQAGHRIVEIPASNLKKHITEILYDQGYILKYKFEEGTGKGKQGLIKIALKYDPMTRNPIIRELGRISKPGLRKYAKAGEIPRIINGLGICIVSTSRGLMTDKQAREAHVGGELLCYVY
ncbi:MAG TPA: 30S ribosomal protein S8 [Saprospiraceae bacterium]|nr:30S ribosomal protein S8 [Saprospiraceae bacterium]HMQ83194.1 30S ribosomal protein S8 [Saprospiraceae bacterium]